MAGHETTVNLIGNALVALYNHPAELEKLKADPQLMPQAVEEFLRYDSSVQQLPRVAQTDVDDRRTDDTRRGNDRLPARIGESRSGGVRAA